MLRFIHRTALVLALAVPAVVSAQDSSARARSDMGPLSVRTFNLRWLSSHDAATLVSPYVGWGGGGAFDAGPFSHAITVRGTKAALAAVDSVLRENDREPATVVLRFQLIAAVDSAIHDPSIADLDATLRGLFRFGGYRLLAQGATNVSEQSQFLLTMSSGNVQYQISGSVRSVQTTSGRGSGELNVTLQRGIATPISNGQGTLPTRLFNTGLAVTLGQTVVLGSAAGAAPGQALILTVHTELAPPPKP